MYVDGLPGGAIVALTTAERYVDLSAFAGKSVWLWCSDGDIWFSFAPAGTTTGTLVTTTPTAASTTAMVAARIAAGFKAPRRVTAANSVLVVRTVTGTGTLKVKLASHEGERVQPHPEMSTSVTSSATVTGAVTVTQGTPTKTSNTTYQTPTTMAADVDCAAITVGPEGRLEISVKWTAASTQIGTLVLQALSVIDGTTYVDIPGSSGGFGQHPNNDTAETIGYFRELQPFTTVRLKYRRTSGGAAGNNFTAATLVM